MNELITFEDQEIRVVGKPERPEWVAADVCRVLGIAQPHRAVANFELTEKRVDSFSRCNV
jgi:prophage antirepressor-like protein